MTTDAKADLQRELAAAVDNPTAIRSLTPDRRAGGMNAHARLATQLVTSANGNSRSRVSTLHSEAPFALRLTRAKAIEPWAAHRADAARVSVAAGAAGPVGGDQLALHVHVGAGSSLVLSEISPTLVLPGPHGEQSRTQVRIRVETGGTLIWLPELMIAARGCAHLNDVRVDLDQGARFFMREELLLGRHGERPGRLTQRVRVRLADRPLYRQDLDIGTPSTTTPVVIADYRAVGSALIVDPSWVDHPPAMHQLSEHAAVLPLNGPAAVITAVAHDNLALRTQLQAGLAALGPPWNPQP